ncbi:MAG: hypothetical protein GSR84_05655 [Desulfurococcales archaeon]|nr:hypothetical protein [Desulfurococcales archaeon]
MRRRPPFASGRIAGDYEPLFLYWEAARRAGREDLVERAMLREEDYRLASRLAREAGRLGDLLDRLEEVMLERVDPGVAAEAYRMYGAPVGDEDARRLIARLLASWLVEAAEHWGFLRLRGLGDRHPAGEGE